MDDSVEQQLSQALLEKLEPLINTVESQLRDLAQGQVLLQSNVAQLSSELSLTQVELDKVHDTFARLPHYVAKLAAMKNTIASVTALSRKLKRRADQVVIGREKQAAKILVARAKEQAYDQAVAAVQATSTSSQPQSSRHSTSSMSSIPISSVAHDISGTPTQTATMATGTGLVAGGVSIQSPQSQQSSPASSARLPFPLPAKPAFPVVSTMRSSGSPPPSISPNMSSLLAGKISDRDMVVSPSSATTAPNQSFDNTGQLQERVDRFPQVSSIQDDASITAASSSEVEVVRLRRKKKPASRSSTSSIASISTTTSTKRGQGAKNAKSG
ncbi:hypothetical protein BGX26_009926 [Mortierella sp. AD094]|nr:hypothetical protein BGX26_009926 [Mortierella sp. AD094]